jgi:hypothetical protein
MGEIEDEPVHCEGYILFHPKVNLNNIISVLESTNNFDSSFFLPSNGIWMPENKSNKPLPKGAKLLTKHKGEVIYLRGSPNPFFGTSREIVESFYTIIGEEYGLTTEDSKIQGFDISMETDPKSHFKLIKGDRLRSKTKQQIEFKVKDIGTLEKIEHILLNDGNAKDRLSYLVPDITRIITRGRSSGYILAFSIVNQDDHNKVYQTVREILKEKGAIKTTEEMPIAYRINF